MTMETRDPYVNRIVKAAKRLIERGLTDPSASEIACEMLGDPQPADPLGQPAALGGEIYNGVVRRLPKVRRQLEDVENIQCALISSMYYKLGKRVRPVDDTDDALMCLPSARRIPNTDDRDSAVGLLAVKEGDENLIYRLWLEANGKPGASRTRRALEQAAKAHAAGLLTADNAGSVIDAVDAHLRVTPAQARAQIGHGNGSGGPALPPATPTAP